MERVMAKLRWIALAMLVSLLTSACASPRSPPARIASELSRGDDDRIEVRLGPHRLRLPIGSFRYGIVPQSDRRFELALRLPDYAPMTGDPAPGDIDQAARLDIDVVHIDGIPATHMLSYWLREEPPDASPDPLGGDLPRVRGPPEHGLQVFRLAAPAESLRGDPRDRLLAMPDTGTPAAYIECTPRDLDDGVTLVDGRPVRRASAGDGLLAVCDHAFMLDDTGIAVYLHYARAYLPQWRAIQAHVAGRLRRAMTASP